MFEYEADQLSCERVPLTRIAAEVGTPTYVYSLAALRAGYHAYDRALAAVPHLVCYAIKANDTLAVIRAFAREGRPLSLSQLARAIGAPVSSCFGIVRTLEARGYLYEVKARGGFYPTKLLFEHARVIASHDPRFGSGIDNVGKQETFYVHIFLSQLADERVSQGIISQNSHSIYLAPQTGQVVGCVSSPAGQDGFPLVTNHDHRSLS